MSGFLHRLAAQALGNANTLRSAARLPYATPLSPNLETPEYAAEPDGQGGNEPHHPANTGRARNSAPVQEHRHTGASVQSSAAPASPSALPEILILQPLAFAASPNRTHAQSSSWTPEKIGADETPTLVEGIETPAHTQNLSAGQSFTTDPAGHNQHYSASAESSSAFSEKNAPTPLLPPKNAPRAPAFNVGAAAQRGDAGGHAWQGQVEETTEVHVSIGRIEVTAVHEAPPPKRQAPAAAKPMTLDEYLARRKKEA